jgi:MFS transporter, FHS family, L-fucose permease
MKKSVQALDTSKNFVPLAILMVLFFLCGFSSVLNTILIPYLQHTLNSSYTSVNLVPVSFYTAYFIFSPATAYLLKKISYTTGMRIGIAIAIMGTLILSYAASIISFPMILVGIFFLGGGIAILQVTGNPYVMMLGSIESGSRRMVLVHSVTALGMIIAPFIGSHFILGAIDSLPVSGIGPLGITYLSLAAMWVFLFHFSYLLPHMHEKHHSERAQHQKSSIFNLFRDPVLILGAIGITTSVGIEVTCSSFMVKYIASSKILGVSLATAGKWSIAFWVVFTLGRFTGTALLKHIREETALLIHCFLGLVFAWSAIVSYGLFGAVSIIAMGFATSILFPVIFSLTLQRAKSSQRNISAVLCMANIGGALYPLTQGIIADHYGIHLSYIVPFCGFVVIGFYGYKIYKKQYSFVV